MLFVKQWKMWILVWCQMTPMRDKWSPMWSIKSSTERISVLGSYSTMTSVSPSDPVDHQGIHVMPH